MDHNRADKAQVGTLSPHQWSHTQKHLGIAMGNLIKGCT
jgi:hypothetical protein